MKKLSIFIMLVSAAIAITFSIIWFHPVTDNVVDSNGFWSYMYGASSIPWPVFASCVIFLMGLTMFFATGKQQSRRYN